MKPHKQASFIIYVTKSFIYIFLLCFEEGNPNILFCKITKKETVDEETIITVAWMKCYKYWMFRDWEFPVGCRFYESRIVMGSIWIIADHLMVLFIFCYHGASFM